MKLTVEIRYPDGRKVSESVNYDNKDENNEKRIKTFEKHIKEYLNDAQEDNE